jgi:hypothetical protein
MLLIGDNVLEDINQEPNVNIIEDMMDVAVPKSCLLGTVPD